MEDVSVRGQDLWRSDRGGGGVVCGRGRARWCLVHDRICASLGNEFGGGGRGRCGGGVGTASSLEVLDAFFQVVDVVDAGLWKWLAGDQDIGVRGGSYLKNCQFVHLLTPTGGNHILQCAKLFIHLGPAAALDQAVGGFPRNLAASSTVGARLLLL
jgi:hypothetical protein